MIHLLNYLATVVNFACIRDQLQYNTTAYYFNIQQYSNMQVHINTITCHAIFMLTNSTLSGKTN